MPSWWRCAIARPAPISAGACQRRNPEVALSNLAKYLIVRQDEGTLPSPCGSPTPSSASSWTVSCGAEQSGVKHQKDYHE